MATTRRRDPTGAEKHQPLQETTVTLLLSCKPYSRLLHHSVLSPETQALPSGKSPSPDACLGSVLQCGANPFLPQTNANGGGESRGRAGTPRGDAAFNTPAKNTERPPLLPGSCPQAAVSCWGKPSRGQGGSSTGVEGGLTAPPPNLAFHGWTWGLCAGHKTLVGPISDLQSRMVSLYLSYLVSPPASRWPCTPSSAPQLSLVPRRWTRPGTMRTEVPVPE